MVTTARPPVRTCEQCGKEILDRHPSARFCLEHGTPRAAVDRYNARARAAREPRTCKVCGKAITGRPVYALFCAVHGTPQEAQRRYDAKVKAARPPRKCKCCDTDISGKHGLALYCDVHGTPQEAQRRYDAKVKAARIAEGPPPRFCRECGVQIEKGKHLNAWYCDEHATAAAAAARYGGSGDAEKRTCAEVGCEADISNRSSRARYCTIHSAPGESTRRWQAKDRAARPPRTCEEAECEADISTRSPNALYCAKHRTPPPGGRSARRCRECRTNISGRPGNSPYCAEHGGQAGKLRRQRAAAEKARMERTCKQDGCGRNIGYRSPGARYCEKHGASTASTRRHLATQRAHKTSQEFRRSDRGSAALRALAHQRRGAPGDVRNIQKLTEIVIWRIENGVTVPCGICGNPIDRIVGEPTRRAFQIDHRVPIKPLPGVQERGTNDRENLQPAHPCCNRSKRNRPQSPINPTPNQPLAIPSPYLVK